MLDFERPINFNTYDTQTWADYYTKKSKIGSGIPGYHGDIFQRGNGVYMRGDGLWDTIARFGVRFGLPIVKYLGPKLAETAVGVASDAIAGENVLESIKTRGKSTAKDIAEDIVAKAGSKLLGGGRKRRLKQKGSGAKRRRVQRGRGKRSIANKNLSQTLRTLLG